ncbi:hypothetical protein [Caulobacter sp. NIBR2454]|uniref:hypothetical protein n=1 Tax=Caulobacter sp. NIBR2454 TaxID=3015996 RepID=UPI0022B63F63|nr:hypothetical protein [Caulobacter sp. NIBR2454]
MLMLKLGGSRKRLTGLALISVFGLAGGIGFLKGAQMTGAEDSPIPLAVLLVLLVIALTAALRLSWKWWASVDEGVRSAHMNGWYHGGSIATMLALVIALALFAGPQTLTFPLSGAGELFGLGVLFCVAVQLVGYGVGWAIWWARASR